MVSEPSISASNSTMAASSSAMASSSTAPITSVNGFKYYVLFIDRFTRFTWIYLLQSKSEVLDKFVHFKNLVENQFSVKIKTFRSDGGGEYTSTIFKSYLSQNDIIHQISCHTLLSKMAWLKGSTDILLRPQSHCCLKLPFQLPIGLMLFKQQSP